jgi:uncharacterized membrane protein
MGNLIAFGFDRFRAAGEVLNKLRPETAIEDAFVVERAASGRCEIRRVKSAVITPKTGAPFRGGLWGAMVRLLFLNPSLDVAIPRGGSGLFILLKSAAEDRILMAIKPYGARILETSLPPRGRSSTQKSGMSTSLRRQPIEQQNCRLQPSSLRAGRCRSSRLSAFSCDFCEWLADSCFA